MQLQSLARSAFERGIANLIAHIEVFDQLSRCEFPAWNTGAGHHRIDFTLSALSRSSCW